MSKIGAASPAPAETDDFAVTATLTGNLTVSEYVGGGHSVPRAVRTGSRVTITYNHGATNCGIRVHRNRDNTIIDRDLVAAPADVLAAAGIDVKKAAAR